MGKPYFQTRQADELRQAERRDRESMLAQRNKRKPWPEDRQRKAQRKANAERDQLPLIVPAVVPPVVQATLDQLRALRTGTPAELRAAQERRDRDRAPLVSEELRRPLDSGL